MLGPELGALFAELHSEHGVRFHFGASLTEITGQDGMVLAARTDDGEEHPAHAVLAAIGAAPRTALAEAAGLELADPPPAGRPRRRAAADVRPGHLRGGGRRVLPARAVRDAAAGGALGERAERGPAAARSMLGRDEIYDRVPYFFTDQYDLGMEYSGWAPPGSYDQVVVRGDAGKREFIAFWVRRGVFWRG